MPYFDNPAGRLHDLLVKLGEQPGDGSLLDAWATVLGVAPEDVAVHLGEVAELVRGTQESVNKAGEDALLPIVASFRDSWTQPIFPRATAFENRLEKVLPDSTSLDALGVVSAHLHAIAPEGVVPGEGELERRKEELRSLINEVEAATDIPAEVKHLLIARLRGVEEAIDHLKVGGPGAIQHAMEAAMGSLIFTPDARRTAKSPAVQKMITILWAMWAIFAAGQPIHGAIEGWGETIQMLSPGPENPSQESAPPVPAGPDGHHKDQD